MNVRTVLAVLAIQFVAGCASGPPTFKADPNWPQPLPEEGGVQLVMGQVAGIAVNPKDNHVWIIHRPASLLPDEWNAKENRPVTHRCCKSAPPVMEFDASGKYLRGWGPQGPEVQWPKTEHGIHIDPDGNVWIGGNGNEDNQVLKLTPSGAFRQIIGFPGKSQGSNSTQQLGRPASMEVSGKEIFIADGYGNRRLVVFDADTGVYKRHWGAYGGRPNDDQQPPYDPKAQLSRQFGNPVHCVRVSNDGKVYVCDRVNNRIQVFGKEGDFQGEFRVEVQTLAGGSAWDMVLSHDPKQRYMYVADGSNGRIYILERADGKLVGQFGRTGRMPGEFKWIHNLAVDKDGNLYTAEVGFGRRIQKFTRSGGSF